MWTSSESFDVVAARLANLAGRTLHYLAQAAHVL